jgi:hypothetical protein
VSNLTVWPTTTTTYYAEAYTATSVSARKAVTVTVNPLPVITSSTSASRTGAGVVTLGATANTGEVRWYNAATGGTLLETGDSYTTSITSTTDYYAEAFSSNCGVSSPRTKVTATIIPSSGGADGYSIHDLSTRSCSTTGTLSYVDLTIGAGASASVFVKPPSCQVYVSLVITGTTTPASYTLDISIAKYSDTYEYPASYDVTNQVFSNGRNTLVPITGGGDIYKITITNKDNNAAIPKSGGILRIEWNIN